MNVDYVTDRMEMHSEKEVVIITWQNMNTVMQVVNIKTGEHRIAAKLSILTLHRCVRL